MIDWVTALPLAIGIIGLAGLVFTALAWRRNDSTQVITQQAQITAEMKQLTDELRTQRDECRSDRQSLQTQIEKLLRDA